MSDSEGAKEAAQDPRSGMTVSELQSFYGAKAQAFGSTLGIDGLSFEERDDFATAVATGFEGSIGEYLGTTPISFNAEELGISINDGVWGLDTPIEDILATPVTDSYFDTGIVDEINQSSYNSTNTTTVSTQDSFTTVTTGNWGAGQSYSEIAVFENESFFNNVYGTTVTNMTSINGQIVSSTRTRDMFGVSVTTDQHYNEFNQELGMLDELVADVIEALGFEVDAKAASAIQSSTTAALNVAFGGIPTTALGTVTLLGQVTVAVSDIAYANGYIDTETRNMARGLSAGLALAGTTISTVEALEVISTLRSYGVISSVQALLATTISIVQLGYSVNSFLSVLTAYGIITTPTISSVMAYTLANPMASDSFDKTGSAKNTYREFAEWYRDNSDVPGIDVNSVQEDVYGFMAGGERYDLQMAGSVLYHPGSFHNVDGCVEFSLSIDSASRQAIFQEDAIYKDLEQVKTRLTSNDSLNKLAYAKKAKFNALIDARNALVAIYEEKVDAYNSDVAIYQEDVVDFQDAVDAYNNGDKSQSAYESLMETQTDLESQQQDILTAKASLEAQIEELMAEIEDIEEDIIELVS